MGINGLLPILKPIAKQRHVKEYRGRSCAVDGFSWLHKGAYGCARELCEGIYTDKFVLYCMSKVEMLLSNGVQPVIVFDGGRLPMKADEEDGRRRSRRENLEKARQHVQCGNVTAAEECYQRAVNITSSMSKQWIEALKERGVSFVVAPYEADAQMAHLALSGHVWAVITEDSDLLAYGCPRVFFKMDKFGNGEEICIEDLPLNTGTSFQGFDHTMFVEMCIMAGCDFVSSLPGIGTKKAHQHIRKLRSFVKVCKSLRFSGTQVPRGYEERVQRALWVFRHQRVFCSRTRAIVHLRPLPPGGLGAADVDVPSAVPVPTPAAQPSTGEGGAQQEDELSFLGPWIPPDIACGIAEGDLDPTTKQPYDLATIYSGAKRMPPRVAQALGLNSTSSQHHQGSQQQRGGHPRPSNQSQQAAHQQHQAQAQPQQHPWQAPILQPSSQTAADAPATGLAPPGGRPPAYKVSGLRRTSGGRAAATAGRHTITNYFPAAAGKGNAPAPGKGNARAAFLPPRMAGGKAAGAVSLGGGARPQRSQASGSECSGSAEGMHGASGSQVPSNQQGGEGASDGAGMVLSSPLGQRHTPGKKMRVTTGLPGSPSTGLTGSIGAQTAPRTLFPTDGGAVHAAVLGATVRDGVAGVDTNLAGRQCTSQPLADATNFNRSHGTRAPLHPEHTRTRTLGCEDQLEMLPPKPRPGLWAAPEGLDAWGRPSGGMASSGGLHRVHSAPGPLQDVLGGQEEVESEEVGGSSGAGGAAGSMRAHMWYVGGEVDGGVSQLQRRQPISAFEVLARPCHSSGTAPSSTQVMSQATSGTLPLASLAIPFASAHQALFPTHAPSNISQDLPQASDPLPQPAALHSISDLFQDVREAQGEGGAGVMSQPQARRIPSWAAPRATQRPREGPRGPSPFFGSAMGKAGLAGVAAGMAEEGEAEAAAAPAPGVGVGSRLKALLQVEPQRRTQPHTAPTAPHSTFGEAVTGQEAGEEGEGGGGLRHTPGKSRGQQSIAQHLFGEFAMPMGTRGGGAHAAAGAGGAGGVGSRMPDSDAPKMMRHEGGRTPGSAIKLHTTHRQSYQQPVAGGLLGGERTLGADERTRAEPMDVEDLTLDTDEEDERAGRWAQGGRQAASASCLQGTQLIGEQLISERGRQVEAAPSSAPDFHSLDHMPGFCSLAESVINGVAAAAVDAVAGGTEPERPIPLSVFAFGAPGRSTPHGVKTAVGKSTPGGRTPRGAAAVTESPLLPHGPGTCSVLQAGRTPATAPAGKARGLLALRGIAPTPVGAKGGAGRSAGKEKRKGGGRGGGTGSLIPGLFVVPCAAGAPVHSDADAGDEEQEEPALCGNLDVLGHGRNPGIDAAACQKLHQPFKPPGTAGGGSKVQQGLARFAFGSRR